MEALLVFHTDFHTGAEHYMKMSVITGDHAFTAICNSKGAVSVQRFVNFKYINIYGYAKQAGAYTGIERIAEHWNEFTAEQRKAAVRCVSQLPRSYRRLCQIVSIPQNEQIEMHNFLSQIYHNIQGMQNGTYVAPETTSSATPAPEPTASEDGWQNADLSNMTMDEAQKIVDTLAIQSQAVINNTVYRSCNGVIQCKKDWPFPRTRKIKKMAFFKPNQAFGAFQEGDLYEVKISDNAYATLLLEDNTTRDVLKERLAILDVFDEAPAMA